MTAPWDVLDLWPARALLAGGAVLLAGRLLLGLTRQPARRTVVGTAAVAAALLTVPLTGLPGWLPVPVAGPAEAASAPTRLPGQSLPAASGEPDRPEPPSRPPLADRAVAPAVPTRLSQVPSTALPLANVAPKAPEPVQDPPFEPVALTAYGLIATGLLGRLLIGHLGLARLWRAAHLPPEWAGRAFRELAAETCPRAQLRVSPRVAGPVCFGIARPRVLVPAGLLAAGRPTALRCVLAHELGHLRRRDPLAGWLLGLARAVYFVWPWLAGLRREVRVAQEWLADADAAAQAAGPAEYAELLIQLARPRPAPLGAAGARGPRSELYRRVTMLLRPDGPAPARFPRRWALAVGGGLTALAVTAAGLHVQPRPAAAAEPEKKEAPRPAPAGPGTIKDLFDKLKKDVGDDPEAQKKLEELQKSLKPARPADPDPAAPRAAPPAAPPDFPALPRLLDPDLPEDELLKELMQSQDQLLRQLQGMLGQFPRNGAGPGPIRPGDPDQLFNQMLNDMLGQLGQGPGGGLMIGPGGARAFGRGAGGGRLGVTVEKPGDVLAAQLDLPNGQGLVCVDVPADSNAAKVGIRPNDILVEVGGKAVSSDVPTFAAALKEIKPDQPVDVVVLRKGKRETLKGVKLPAAREVAERPLPALPALPRLFDPELPGLPRPDVAAPRPALPGLPGAAGETARVEQVNDAFTVFYSKNGVKVTVAGSKGDDGVAKAESIEVEDNGKTTKAESIDKLPKEYQDLAKAALKAVK